LFVDGRVCAHGHGECFTVSGQLPICFSPVYRFDMLSHPSEPVTFAECDAIAAAPTTPELGGGDCSSQPSCVKLYDDDFWMEHFAALPAPVYAARRAPATSRKRAAVPLHRLLSVLDVVLVMLVQHCVVSTSPALAFVSQQAQAMQAELLAEQQSCCSDEEPECCKGRLHCCLEGFLAGVEACPACGPSTFGGVHRAVCVWDLHKPVPCGLIEMPVTLPVFDQWILPSLNESNSGMTGDYALWCAHACKPMSPAECSQLLRCCGPACENVDYGSVTCCTSAIDSMLPHGEQSPVPEAKYEKTEHGWIIGHHPLYTPADITQLQELLVGLKHCFAYSMSELTGYTGTLGYFRIPFRPECEDKSVWVKARPHSIIEREVQDEKCLEMLNAGIIQPSKQTRFASEVVIAAKKDAETGLWTDKRFCVNLVPINKCMEIDRYRLPLADEIFEAIGDCCIFSKMDARSGFFQWPILPAHRERTAFWWRQKTGELQLYEFTRMPFGLHNAPQQWQHLMDQELANAGCSGFAKAFIDDILIFSKTAQEHNEHVRRVLTALQAVGLKMHPDKSLFACDVVEYLGFNVSKYGLTPHQAKVAAIDALQPPTCVEDVRSVLGLMSYYRRFVPNFSATAAPLNLLLGKDTPWQWGEAQQASFDELKRILTTEGLALKRVHPDLPLILYCDWSVKGIGCCLAQLDSDGTEHLCACISRSLNVHEKNYCSYKGELLAVVWSCMTLRQLIHGRKVTVVTDHAPLTWLINSKDLHGQYGRWRAILSEYDMDIVHRPGKSHANADALSRLPMASTQDVSGARLDVEACACVVCSGQCDVSPVMPVASSSLVPQPTFIALSSMMSCSPLHAFCGPVMHHVSSTCDSAACTPPYLVDASLHSFALMQHALSQPTISTAFSLCEQYEVDCDRVSSCQPMPAVSSAVAEQRISSLRARASQWCAAAYADLQSCQIDQPHYHDWRPACVMRKGKECRPVQDRQGVRPTGSICTQVIGEQFFGNALADGVCVLELFGGMCAGLEMLLRNGIRVQCYVYCDLCPTVQRVAAHRLYRLAEQYPALLSPAACRNAFTSLPQNVWKVDSAALVRAGLCDGSQWLVVAGFECQDLSPAGSGKGVKGQHSSTFFALRTILGALQQLQQQKPPGYFIENTYLGFDFGKIRHTLSENVQLICSSIGQPVSCDAVQFDSYAHRMRHYWTNLAPAEHLQAVLKHVHRSPGLHVSSIMFPHRLVFPVEKSDRAPFYVCNQQGQPRSAFPTFVAFHRSRAFTFGAPGAVWDSARQEWTEPCPDEREAAMGYDVGTTLVADAPGQARVTEAHRHAITGKAMDQNAVSSLLAICLALSTACCTTVCASAVVCHPTCSTTSPTACQTFTAASAESSAFYDWSIAVPVYEGNPHFANTLHCMAAMDEEVLCSAPQRRDIWKDPVLLLYVREGLTGAATSPTELRRLKQRAQHYSYTVVNGTGVLHRRMSDGSVRVVPPPAERTAILTGMHERTGHWGEKRLIHMALSSVWWYSLYKDAYAVVKGCELCRQVNSSFHAKPPELCPLPIMSLMYRWSADLCGEFLPTARSHRYIAVFVEHYSKTLRLVPLTDKQPETVAQAFLSTVLSAFGACAECVTDGGSEFRGAFEALLESCYITHRVTAPNNPSANGLAERCVQSVKQALRKHCAQSCNVRNWDVDCYWIQLGYNASTQASTKLSPYELLHARPCTVPPAIVQRMSEQHLCFDDPTAAAESLLQRAALVQQLCVEAGSNLQVAQHRDTLRYAMIRSGEYKPSLVKFWPGQFVYVRRSNVVNTLQIPAYPQILRVVELRPGGVAILQGKCGSTIHQSIKNLAPCHLPGIDPTVDPTLARVSADHPCEVCRFPDREGEMLLCDNCNTGWHLDCLTPKLTTVPRGHWLCPYCVLVGVTLDHVWTRQAVNELAQSTAVKDVAPLFAKRRQRLLLEAQSLHGRYVIYPLPGPGRTKVPTWGLVQFLGEDSYPACLRVCYPTGAWYERTLKGVRPYLQSIHAQPPASVTITTPIISAATVIQHVPAALPARWNLCVQSELLAAHQQLMPGAWSELFISGTHANIHTWYHSPSSMHPDDIHASGCETQSLLRVLAVDSWCNVLDPFGSPYGGVSAQLASRCAATVTVNSSSPAALAHLHRDALQPEFWTDYLSQRIRPDAVVTCAPPCLLELALPLIIRHVPCVCVLVPHAYTTDAPKPRVAWLRDLQATGRLQVIVSSLPHPRDATHHCLTWLCVFASAAWRLRCLSAPYRTSQSFAFLVD
jgi:hypothetical protein